ncbi:MAG: phosphatase PAP2 family protein [Actinobacteria bacterium]|nr:phosphatase PAP2 family protein [Actinomycetota bacterium]
MTAAAVLFTIVTVDVVRRGALVTFDHDVSRTVTDWGTRRHKIKYAVYLLTLFGQRGTVLVVSIPTVAYVIWRTRSVDPVVRYVLALVLMTVVVYSMKYAVGRGAPPIDGLHIGGESYPSGHVANAILVWGLMWYCVARVEVARQVRVVANLARVIGPISVVIGMTLLDYHWASDFLGGIGIGIVLLSVVTTRWLRPLTARVDAIIARRGWGPRDPIR